MARELAQNALQVIAVIEAVLETGQIAVRIRGEFEGVIHACDRVFQISSMTFTHLNSGLATAGLPEPAT